MRRAQHLALLEAVGDEDVGFEPGRGGVGRHAVGQVARRGAADGLEPELDGLRKCHRDDAVLERERRIIDGVVLDVELGDAERLGQPVGPDKRRAADVAADRRLAVERQQLAVSPHRPGPRCDRRPGHRARHLLVVVRDFERTEILGTEIECFLGIELAAQATLQTTDCLSGHR